MTGPEHYREAERLLASCAHEDVAGPYYDGLRPTTIAAAQVHATLALAAHTESPDPADDETEVPF